MSEPIGEIIETSTTEFLAQTGGLEPGAQPVMRGRSGVRDEAIFHENPDLRAVLRTEFAALIVGFCEDGDVRQYLPAYPPPLHWSVQECEPADLATFSNQLDY